MAHSKEDMLAALAKIAKHENEYGAYDWKTPPNEAAITSAATAYCQIVGADEARDQTREIELARIESVERVKVLEIGVRRAEVALEVVRLALEHHQPIEGGLEAVLLALLPGDGALLLEKKA